MDCELELHCNEDLEEGEINDVSVFSNEKTTYSVLRNVKGFIALKTASVRYNNIQSLQICELGLVVFNDNKNIEWCKFKPYSMSKYENNFSRQFIFLWHPMIDHYRTASDHIFDFIQEFKTRCPGFRIAIAGEAYKNVPVIQENMDIFVDISANGYAGTSLNLARIPRKLELKCKMHPSRCDLAKTCVKADCLAFYAFLREFNNSINYSEVFNNFKFSID